MKNKYLLVAIGFFAITNITAQNTEFWGMTNGGGDFGIGTIFKTDGNGDNHSIQKSFNEYLEDVSRYSKLCEHDNGKLYGLTTGSIFEFDPTNSTYTILVSLDGLSHGALIKASNGKLYGMTYDGGISDKGVLFEYDPADSTYTKKIDFDSESTGSNPLGSLTESSNGKLYGMTRKGGTSNEGVLFEYDITNLIFTKKIDFDSASTGSNPHGSLIEASNGKLYGMTYDGGALDKGVIFEYDPVSLAFFKILDFDGASTGANPHGSLMEASNGKLYGMTYNGGAISSRGALFEYNVVDSVYTRLYDFDGRPNGQDPAGSLMQASNGKLYGMTVGGGSRNTGALFEYNIIDSLYTKKFDLDYEASGGNAYGTLMEASNGKIYGMTYRFTAYDGSLFEYIPSTSTFLKKLNFRHFPQGANPYGSLLKGSNGKLYGLTPGGRNDAGFLFEYDPIRGNYINTLHFDSASNGGNVAHGKLMEASNGKMYGMRYGGGTSNYGVLFEYDPVNVTYTKKIDFEGRSNGSSPYGSLIEASNGKLYGMTSSGGSTNKGVLFEYEPANDTYTKKLDFDGTTNGQTPKGSLIEASNGKLYGMTSRGGATNYGVLFEYDPSNNTYTKKLDFNGTSNGQEPYGSLIEASNGKLYGMTHGGGVSNKGVMFEYDPINNIYTKKLDFDGTSNGQFPYGSLMEASNGKLYGMTNYGGTSSEGVLFEYNLIDSIYAKKLDFDGSNGSGPYYGSLVEVAGCVQNTKINLINACDSITWIDGVTYTSSNNNATHTLTNIAGCDSIITLDLTINTTPDASIVVDNSIIEATESGLTYQWLDCSNNAFSPIIGETKQNLSPPESGDYAVEIMENDCIDTSECTEVIVTCYSHYTTTYDSGSNEFTLTVGQTTADFATAYNWDFGDGTTSTDATPSHTYTTDSIYNVCLAITTADTEICSYCHEIGKDSAGNVIRVAGFTLNVINPYEQTDSLASGINAQLQQNIVVFPNPTTGLVTILFDAEISNGSVTVLNALGQSIYEQNNFSGKELSFDINNEASGVYIIEINQEPETTRVKLFKE